ncbi:nitroreductase family protein [Ilumatobacter nonamiensis]|uniref:nitroreductase family protein n=1 Tax=Ilumatobacter nonamiensis TaxID=467093 RepID=UPI00034C51E6|nr:nitroreductase family protein [Ilumatobacter nonamiensis]
MKSRSAVDLLHGLATTRSIRRYTDDPVDPDDLRSILWYAGRAPSGSNRQPFRFLVLRDGPDARRAKSLLGDAFRSGWNAKREADGYRPSRFADSMQRYVDRFESIPVVILVCLDRYREPDPTEGASVYPACQNLLLAARAHGYGGAMTMWHLGVESELRELLGIPSNVGLSACITLGVPEGSHGPVRRKPLDEIVFDDRWEAPADWVDGSTEEPQ